MKKIISTMAIILVTHLNVCSATIPNSELSLGGITCGASEEYVLKIYGKPDKIMTYNDAKDYFDGKAKHYLYGEDFDILFDGNSVFNIKITGANGISTPSGLMVGMKETEIYKKYGTPDSKSKNTCYYHLKGKGLEHLGIRFDFEKGKITSIMCGEFI